VFLQSSAIADLSFSNHQHLPGIVEKSILKLNGYSKAYKLVGKGSEMDGLVSRIFCK
jgi:hypothetical protein